MKEKENKNSVETCNICKRMIFLKTDNYIRVTDYKLGKFFSEGFYHNSCYHRALGNSEDLQMMKQQTMTLLSKAMKMMKDYEDDRGEVIHI